jgi:sec-independent protein translocase protein TatA
MAPHWTGILIVAILALLLFGGRGKITSIMGDFAKGITAFRKGLKDEEQEAADATPTVEGETAEAEKSGDKTSGS